MNSQLLDLMEKIGKNIALTPVEQIRLRREIQNIEEVVSVMKGLLDPGTSMLQIDNIRIANNDVHMDEFGVFIKNQEGEIGFQNTAKTSYDLIAIYSDASDALIFANQVGGPGIGALIDSATHKVMQMDLNEDAGLAERLLLRLAGNGTNDKGSRVNLSDKMMLTGEGAAGGSTTIIMSESSDPSGENIVQDVDAQIYIRANKFIIRWNDAGTTRYKYLDLTGVGVTWTHTTVAP